MVSDTMLETIDPANTPPPPIGDQHRAMGACREIHKIQQRVLFRFQPFRMPLQLDWQERLLFPWNVKPDPKLLEAWVKKHGINASHAMIAARPDFWSVSPHQEDHLLIAFPYAVKMFNMRYGKYFKEDEFLRLIDWKGFLKTIYDAEGTIETHSWQNARTIQIAIRLLLRPFAACSAIYMFPEAYDADLKYGQVFSAAFRGAKQARDNAMFWIVPCYSRQHWFLVIIDRSCRTLWHANSSAGSTSTSPAVGSLLKVLEKETGQSFAEKKIPTPRQDDG